MALRYELPIDVVGRGFGPMQELKVVPAMRPAVTIKIRKDCDYAKVAGQVLANPRVILDGSFAAGKSSILPGELVKVGKRTVFHVTPNPHLASDNFAYACIRAKERPEGFPPLVRFANVLQTFPDAAWVFIGAAELVGLLLVQREVLAGKVLYLDESHDSEAFTAVLRTLSAQFGAAVVVEASATHGPGGSQMMESGGHLERDTYEPEHTLESWNVSERGKPWTAAAVKNNIAVFTDSESQAERVAAEYRRSGFETYRLKARMDPGSFRSAMLAMRDVTGPLVALVADKSFRNGFTLDVSDIVDSGVVSYYVVEGGSYKKKYRRLYYGEAMQTGARGARLEGQKTRYSRPDVELPKLICDLEQVEAEAAAYLMRVFGYKPPLQFDACHMAHANLPGRIDAMAAIAGPMPIVCYVAGCGAEAEREVLRIVGVAKEVARRKAEARRAASVSDGSSLGSGGSASGSSRASLVSDAGTERTVFSEHGFGPGSAGGKPDESIAAWDSLVQKLSGRESVDPVVGSFYHAPGLGTVKPVAAFPDGLRSVYKWVAGDHVHVESLRQSERDYALKTVLDRCNVLNVELRAFRKAVARSAVSTTSRGLEPREQDAVMGMVEYMASMETEVTTCVKAVALLAGGYRVLETFEGLPEAEEARARSYEAWLNGIFKPGSDRSASEYQRDLGLLVDKSKVLALDHTASDAGREVATRSHKHRRRGFIEWDPPSWTGLDKVEWEVSRSHRSGGKYEFESVTFSPGPLVSRVLGEESRTYTNGERIRRRSSGRTEVKRY